MSSTFDLSSVCPKVLDFKSRDTRLKFDKWTAEEKLPLIRFISLLTGILYIVATYVDYQVAPKALLPLMSIVHLYILPPLLFLITYLTFQPKLHQLTIIMLILAPIVAVIGNLIIVAQVEQPPLRLTEVYLIIFWTFTVSGLRLREAFISGSISYLIVLLVTTLHYSLSLENYVMHCFWMSSAFSFGLLSAYILERSDKTRFIYQEQLRKLSFTDRLTGLYNRTKLDEILQEELQRSQRYHQTFGLVILDFDYFKEVNDTYGHQVGDLTLKEIAKLLTEHLRTTDTAIRWGGEEFIIIYLNTDKEEVLQLADDLRQKIEHHPFETVGKRTASFGVTLWQEDDTMDTIIQRADKGLYNAKEQGRNRIMFT
jgi:diguanylate cyclase (GGDEF)-like protein